MNSSFPAYCHAPAPKCTWSDLVRAGGIRVVATTSSVEPGLVWVPPSVRVSSDATSVAQERGRSSGGTLCWACTVQAWNPFHLRITADAVSLQPWMDHLSVVAHGGNEGQTDRYLYADRRPVVRQGITNSLCTTYVRCLKYWKKYLGNIPSWTVLWT